MHKLVIMIESQAETAKLEENWPQFLHLVESMPGLRREVSARVEATLFGKNDCSAIHELYFDTLEEAYQALATPQGQDAGRLLQWMTGGHLTLFFAAHLEDELENIQKYQESDASPNSGE